MITLGCERSKSIKIFPHVESAGIRTAVFAVVLIFSGLAAADREEYTAAQLEEKVTEYTRMQSRGTILLSGGAVLNCISITVLVSGIVSAMNDKEADWWYLDPPEGTGRIILGVAGVSISALMTAGGIAVRSIGLRKKRE